MRATRRLPLQVRTTTVDVRDLVDYRHSSGDARTRLGLPDVARVIFEKCTMYETIRNRWLAKLATLRIDRKGTPAPHKPLLLLVIIELAEQGLLPKTTLPLTPELAFRFCTYSNIAAHRRTQKPDVSYPFHHLQGDGCWKALGEDGNVLTRSPLDSFRGI